MGIGKKNMKRYIQCTVSNKHILKLQSMFSTIPELSDADISVRPHSSDTVVVTPKHGYKPFEVSFGTTVQHRGKKSTLIPWDSAYSVSPDGTVYDSDGNEIGIAKIIHTTNDPELRNHLTLSDMRYKVADGVEGEFSTNKKDINKLLSDIE